MIRNAKPNFERKLAKADTGEGQNVRKRKFFSYIKKRTKEMSTIRPLKKDTGETVKDDKGMAEILNKFFSSVFTREDTANIPEPEKLKVEKELKEVKITVAKVKQQIRRLKTGSAPGPDGKIGRAHV